MHEQNAVKLVLSGESFFNEALRIIHTARKFIHLQTYIIEEDATGTMVMDALQSAALRGVKVMVVADGYGTSLSQEVVQALQDAGVEFRLFSPLKGLRAGRRLHHKILLNESGECLIGGINIADKYRGSPHEPAWLDYAVLLKGPVSAQVLAICNFIWKRKFRFPLNIHLNENLNMPAGPSRVGLAQNDWLRNKRDISRMYRRAFAEAEQEIILVASYFLPSRSTRKMMRLAAKRGVKIKVLLSGISDVAFVREATCFLYDWMFRHKFDIYEWQHSVLHGKLMVVDDVWCSIGSYNINKLSDYGSIELNAVIQDADFARIVKETVSNQLITGGRKVDWDTYLHETTWYRRLYNWFCYQLVRVSLAFYLWVSEDDFPKSENQ